MVPMPDTLEFSSSFYCTEVEIDFFIDDNLDLTWYITINFFRPQKTNIIQSYFFIEKNLHLKEVLNNVYWETNEKLEEDLLRGIRLTSQLLDEDYYVENIYPMVVRMRVENGPHTAAQAKKIMKKTQYVW